MNVLRNANLLPLLLLSIFDCIISQQLSFPAEKRSIPVPLPVFLNTNNNPFVPPQAPPPIPIRRAPTSPFNFHNIVSNIKQFFTSHNGMQNQPAASLITPRLMSLLSNPANQMLLENFLKGNIAMPNESPMMASSNTHYERVPYPHTKNDETVVLTAPYKVDSSVISTLLKLADMIPDQNKKVSLMEKVLNEAKPKPKQQEAQLSPTHYATKVIHDIALPNIAATVQKLGDKKLPEQTDKINLFEILKKYHEFEQQQKQLKQQDDIPLKSPPMVLIPNVNHQSSEANQYMEKENRVTDSQEKSSVKKFRLKTNAKDTPEKLSSLLEAYGINTNKLKEALTEKTDELMTLKKLIDTNGNVDKKLDKSSREEKNQADDKMAQESQISYSLDNMVVDQKPEDIRLIRSLLLKLSQQELNQVGKLVHIIIKKPSFLPRILTENLSDKVKHVLQVIQVLKFPQTLTEKSNVMTTTFLPIQAKSWTVKSAPTATTDKTFVPLVYWVDDGNKNSSKWQNKPMVTSHQSKIGFGQRTTHKLLKQPSYVNETRLKSNPNRHAFTDKYYKNSPRINPAYSGPGSMKPAETKPALYKITLLKENLPASAPVTAIFKSINRKNISLSQHDDIRNQVPDRYRTAVHQDKHTFTSGAPIFYGQRQNDVPGDYERLQAQDYRRLSPVQDFNEQARYEFNHDKWQNRFQSTDWKPMTTNRETYEMKETEMQDNRPKLNEMRKENKINYYDHPVSYVKAQAEHTFKYDKAPISKEYQYHENELKERFKEKNFRQEKYMRFKSEELQSEETRIDEVFMPSRSKFSMQDRVGFEDKTRRKYGPFNIYGSKILSDDIQVPTNKVKNHRPFADYTDIITSSLENKERQKYDNTYGRSRSRYEISTTTVAPCLTTTKKQSSNDNTEYLETAASIASVHAVTPGKALIKFTNDIPIEATTTDFAILSPRSKVFKLSTLITEETTTEQTIRPTTPMTTTTELTTTLPPTTTTIATTTTIPPTTTTIATTTTIPPSTTESTTSTTTTTTTTNTTPQHIPPETTTYETTTMIPTTSFFIESEIQPDYTNMPDFEFLRAHPIAYEKDISEMSPFPVYVPTEYTPSTTTLNYFNPFERMQDVPQSYNFIGNITESDQNKSSSDVLISIESDVNNHNKTSAVTNFFSVNTSNLGKKSVFSRVNNIHAVEDRPKGIVLRGTQPNAPQSEDPDLQNYFPVGYWPKVHITSTTPNRNPKRKIKLRWSESENIKQI